MSERKDAPGPSRQDKGKAPKKKLTVSFDIGPPFKKHRPDDPDEQTQKNWSGLIPRFSYLLLGDKESEYIPRTLNQRDVNPINPLLCVKDIYEACVLLDCPQFLALVDQVPYSRTFQVFDQDNEMYNMFFTQNLLGPEWGTFVKDHNLKADDEISFDKNLDTNISDDFYYILKYVRKSSDDGAESSSHRPSNGAESSSKKPNEGSKKSEDAGQSELKAEQIDSIKPKFKVIYHRILLESAPNEEQQNMLGPGSRDFPLEAFCLRKTITSSDVSFGQLFFDLYDAMILTDCPKIAELRTGFCSEDFLIFDEDNRRYDMKMEHAIHRGGIIMYSLHGWEAFHGDRVMTVGDQVTFYKFLDSSVSQGYYFVLKYEVNQPDEFVDQNWTNTEMPGSRALLPENYCFTKTLSRYEVTSGYVGLQLETTEARHFVSLHRNSNDVMVYDSNDRRYYMKLSYYIRGGEIITALDGGGWGTFISEYNLKAGDEISFYKILDRDVCDGYYYVIRYRRS